MFSWASSQLARFGGNGLADLSMVRQAAGRIRGLPHVGIDQVIRAVEASRVDRCGGAMVQNLVGVSIASPTSEGQWKRDREDYLSLPFASATGWGDVLDSVFGQAE